jgi:hypothetical protein
MAIHTASLFRPYECGVQIQFHRLYMSPTPGVDMMSATTAHTYLHLKYALGIQGSVPSQDLLEFSGVESGSVITVYAQPGHI